MHDERPVTEAELQAYADGRLAAGRRAEIDAWLAVRPEEAERIAGYRRFSEELRSHYDPVLAEPVPEQLQHAASGKPRAQSGGVRRAWRTAALAASCAVLGAALGALAGWQLHASRTGPSATATTDGAVMARRAAVAHAVYSPEVRHPVEVGADQEQHLVTWLSKRVGLKLKAPKLEEVGMALVGGRLLPGETGPVAQFMYQSERGRRMTLYVRAESAPNRETAFRYARENNVGVFYWIERDCGYAIASADLDKDELLRVATMVYKQLEP
jgi:anti-sigma factor RsiW